MPEFPGSAYELNLMSMSHVAKDRPSPSVWRLPKKARSERSTRPAGRRTRRGRRTE